MARFRLRAWTGPTIVGQITEACQRAGLIARAGTEHVYVDTDDGHDAAAACWNTLVTILKAEGTDYGLAFKPWGCSPSDAEPRGESPAERPTMFTGDGDRKAFYEAIYKGERAVVSEGLADEFLDMLPPAFMHRTVKLVGGEIVYAAFGIGEGEGDNVPIIAFWPDRLNRGRYFAERVDRLVRH